MGRFSVVLQKPAGGTHIEVFDVTGMTRINSTVTKAAHHIAQGLKVLRVENGDIRPITPGHYND